MKIVEVTWQDADHQFAEIRLAEAELGTPTTTVGYLLKRDKKSISIAMEIVEGGYRNVTTIPRSIVKRVREIEK